MSPEHQVFVDAVMDLGFEPYAKMDPGVALVRTFGTHGGRFKKGWASTITVRVFGSHVQIQWMEGQRSPAFSYLLPEQWVQALSRLRELVSSAEEAWRTGVLPSGPNEPEWGVDNWRIHQRRT